MFSESSTDGQQPNLPPEVFLDTSVFLARLKNRRLRGLADGTVARFRWVGTGSYVMLEYGDIVLTAASYLLDKLRKCESLEDLLNYVNNRLQEQFHAKYKTWGFNLLLEYCNTPDARERAERALRHMLRIGARAVSDRCDDTRDGISCRWLDQPGAKRWHGSSRQNCERKRPPCRIAQFFRENLATFRDIRDTIGKLNAEELTPQLESFAEMIDAAERDPEMLRRDANCHRLADAIIAVQSAAYSCMFTQDKGESSVLCRVLEQVHTLLPQDGDGCVSFSDYRFGGAGRYRTARWD